MWPEIVVNESLKFKFGISFFRRERAAGEAGLEKFCFGPQDFPELSRPLSTKVPITHNLLVFIR